MALEPITLESLGKTELNELFQEAVREVSKSIADPKKIPGKRSISIDLTFDPKENGFMMTTMECTAKVPGRKVSGMASYKEDTVRIDTVSNDARQPDLLEHAGANVKSISQAPSAKKEGAV